jgi:RNA polymerase sigma-70 factor (ECF subfamily)
MAKIVRLVALNHTRKQRGRQTSTLDPMAMDKTNAARETRAEWTDMHLGAKGELPPGQEHFDDRVLSALNGVADVPRACLLLRTVEGMPYAEISQVLDIPEGTAMSHVHRTRRWLRERLRSRHGQDARKGGQA